jgi:hypothetical protein
MAYKERDTVVLVRDIPEHSLRAGDLGAVVHVHSPDSFEVEFIRASGQTQALVMIEGADFRSVRDRDLIAVRQVDPSVGGAV